MSMNERTDLLNEIRDEFIDDLYRPVDLEEREYSFDLELSNDFYDPYKLHLALFKLARINIPVTDKEMPVHKMDPIIDIKALITEIQGSTNVFVPYKERIQKLFEVISLMCDPYTQPWDVGTENILSLDFVCDVIIGSMGEWYFTKFGDESFNLPNFNFAFDVAKIIERILTILNCDDEGKLQSVKNDEINWESNLGKWLPHDSLSSMIHIASDFHHIMLLYTMLVVSLLIIQKLFKKSSNSNICLNPFLRLYLQIWKNMTKVVYLGIEIDRRDEESNFPGYPEVIRYMIKGSSAVRSIISLILNDDFKKREHDLKHESLLNFMHPYGRKFRNGSIKTDMRVFVAALLALGSELEDVTELLFNFEPEDEYDEDIKYMFEMELENMEEYERIEPQKKQNDDDNGNNEENNQFNEDEYHKRHLERVNHYLGIERDDSTPIVRSLRTWELHPDCECTFDSEEEEEDEEEEIEEKEREKREHQIEDLEGLKDSEHLQNKLEKSLETAENGGEKKDYLNEIDFTEGLYAIRNAASKRFEIDSNGKDWRDIPRGENRQLNPAFIDYLKQSQQDSNVFITPMSSLIESLISLTKSTQSSIICEKIIRSIAWVVQYEYEASTMSTEQRAKNSDGTINTDTIYEFLKKDDNFDLMLKFNPSASFSIIDELLMVEGYRRVLIWFLTHLTLNQWIINYFHDLLIGLRGNPADKDNETISLRYQFSRCGSLVLSEMEKSMLLHEFFSNAVIYLSRGSSFEFEDLILDGISSNVNRNKKVSSDVTATTSDSSKFITNRFNAQKLIKVICLVLKSFESNNVLKINDPEYRVEIQTLLIQWVGVGLIPEARELFFKAGVIESEEASSSEEKDKSREEDGIDQLYDPPLVRNSIAPATGTKIKENEKAFQDTDSEQTKKTLSLFQQKLNKMEGLKLYRLFEHTLSVDTFELLTTILHLGAHYSNKKSEILSFLSDLNCVENIYPNEKINEICDLVFNEIGSNIDSGSEENVVEIAFASGIVSAKASVIWVRKIVNEYMQGEVGFGRASEDDDDGDEEGKEEDKNIKKKSKKKKKKRKT